MIEVLGVLMEVILCVIFASVAVLAAVACGVLAACLRDAYKDNRDMEDESKH